MDCFCFFFSSRRRHTRFKCDWSSDVCSSDLAVIVIEFGHRAGTVRLERVDLRKIRGVDEHESGRGADQRSYQKQQAEEDAAYQLPSGNLHRWKIFVEPFHGRMWSG